MVAPGPFIGRESELAELRGALRSARLLTMTGAGGCGKTRLALELARGAGACVTVPLASVAGEEHLLDALLGALGARERFGSTARQVLIQHVAGRRRLLLVLDNCEHLLDPLRGLVGEVLGAAPGVQVLATSRAPLGADGERVFRLSPLRLPDGEDVAAVVQSDAGRLFIQRASSGDPAFAVTPSSARAIARICRGLDGLPLALSLAAGQLQSSSAEEVADRLAQQGRLAAAAGDDGLSPHRSIRASLEWSYQLLDAKERLLLRRLAAFAGGFTIPAVQALAPDGMSDEDVADALTALDLKGLLAPAQASGGEKRWTLLETVGEYATEHLTLAGEREDAARLHLAWFAAYAEWASLTLHDTDGHARVDDERANLRRAVDYALECDPPSAQRIAAALMRHWLLAEHYHEARATCARVLPATPQASTAVLATLQCGAAMVQMLAEEYEEAVQNAYRGLALAEETRGAPSDALAGAAMVLIQTATDLDRGTGCAERAVEIARAGTDRLGLAFALVNLAVARMLRERFDEIAALYEEFLEIPRACEHPRLRAWGEQAMAWAQVSVGSPERALAHADRALALEGDDRAMTYFQVVSFRVHALARMGRTREAIAEGAAALRAAQESRAMQAAPAISLALAVANYMHGDLDAAETHALGLLDMPHLHTRALARETLARSAAARGQPEIAAGHADELEALASHADSARQQAVVCYIRGRAALQAGERRRARDLLHKALETCAESDLERDAADVLDALAHAEQGHDSNEGTAEDSERAARLAGAAAGVRSRLGCAAGPDSRRQERYAAQGAWDEGHTLTLTQAVAYARRGRGTRQRPPDGWASLTAKELEIARLAASGRTNPQIAGALFIARSTVKMHLASVYRKLDVANRTELATTMTRHDTDDGGETTPRAATAR